MSSLNHQWKSQSQDQLHYVINFRDDSLLRDRAQRDIALTRNIKAFSFNLYKFKFTFLHSLKMSGKTMVFWR